MKERSNATRLMAKSALLFAMIFMAFFIPFKAKAATFATDVQAPASGNVFVGLPVSYVADQTAALNRINAIRYEACVEGVINPSTGNPLTVADYVPIKWSADLEQIARIRAAESALTMGHVRTNGSSCFNIASSNNVTSRGEVLAWGSKTLVAAVNLWYSEKSAWVNQSGGVTGHYTIMINPKYTYVGLGGLLTSYCSYKSSMAGEFNDSSANLNSSMQAAAADAIQTVEIPASQITSLTLKASDKTYVGDCNSIYAKLSTYGYSLPLLQASWTSSNPSVVAIDQSGNIYFVSKGTSVITATANGRVYTLALEAKDAPVMKAPSWKKLSAGKKKITAKWKKVSTNVSGYQIQYSTSKNYTSAKTVTISGNKTTSKAIKGLKSKKKYYVRIRTYYQDGGSLRYSAWSGSKKVKVK